MAMDNGPFISYCPNKTSISRGIFNSYVQLPKGRSKILGGADQRITWSPGDFHHHELEVTGVSQANLGKSTPQKKTQE